MYTQFHGDALKLSYLRYSLSCMQWFYRYYFLLFWRIILPAFFLYWVIKFCHLVTKKKGCLWTYKGFLGGGGGWWHKVTIFFQRSLKLQNLYYSSSMSPKYKGVLIFVYFPLSPHLICSQIWQSPFVDDHQSTHLKKLKNKKTMIITSISFLANFHHLATQQYPAQLVQRIFMKRSTKVTRFWGGKNKS